jgi:hypothetical protein
VRVTICKKVLEGAELVVYPDYDEQTDLPTGVTTLCCSECDPRVVDTDRRDVVMDHLVLACIGCVEAALGERFEAHRAQMITAHNNFSRLQNEEKLLTAYNEHVDACKNKGSRNYACCKEGHDLLRAVIVNARSTPEGTAIGAARVRMADERRAKAKDARVKAKAKRAAAGK